MSKQKKAELLSPAGNFEKLQAAVTYGADAVYLAGKQFGMRSASDNFTNDELAEAVDYCHSRNKKIYVTVNVMPHTNEYEELKKHIIFLNEINVDALIISDLGVVDLVNETAPSLNIHISTQASVVSAQTCKTWAKLGAKRIVLARELSLRDIVEIRKNIPEDLEIETFIHGSMCIAYSGRCLLSNYFTGRDANHGACAQPCRWKYSVASTVNLSEESRPDTSVVARAEEDSNGETFFMSSKDMCMIEHIPELEESGISSYKIEGRVKSAYYTAVVTNAYRMAIDAYRRSPQEYRFDPAWMNELCSVSHREYDTGFFFGSPSENSNTVSEHGYIRDKSYLSTALETVTEPGEDGMYEATFIQRNKASIGDMVEIITPGKTGRAFTLSALLSKDGEQIESTPHAAMIFKAKVPFPVNKYDIMRKA